MGLVGAAASLWTDGDASTGRSIHEMEFVYEQL
jgi:hypothetical protein